jgi:hypothetical protein
MMGTASFERIDRLVVSVDPTLGLSIWPFCALAWFGGTSDVGEGAAGNLNSGIGFGEVLGDPR